MTVPMVVWQAGPVVTLADLGELGPPLSQDDGESRGIHAVRRFEGWLVKLYHAPQPPDRAATLDRLVALPPTLPEADRETLRLHTSWPVARVTDDTGQGIGAVLPEAPGTYRARFNSGTERFLELDFLAKDADSLQRRGLPVPTPDDRVRVCLSLTAIAAVLERNGIVYSDWSYSNAFWSVADRTAYVIDIDGAQFGRGPNLHQPNWEDPLTPKSEPADPATDRYRVALLVARCLTGQRELAAAMHALADAPAGPRTELLLDALLATERHRRPTVSSLHAAMTGLPVVRMPVHRLPMPPRPVYTPRTQVTVNTRPVLAGAPADPGAGQRQRGGRTAAVVVAVVLVLIILVICVAAAD